MGGACWSPFPPVTTRPPRWPVRTQSLFLASGSPTAATQQSRQVRPLYILRREISPSPPFRFLSGPPSVGWASVAALFLKSRASTRRVGSDPPNAPVVGVGENPHASIPRDPHPFHTATNAARCLWEAPWHTEPGRARSRLGAAHDAPPGETDGRAGNPRFDPIRLTSARRTRRGKDFVFRIRRGDGTGGPRGVRLWQKWWPPPPPKQVANEPKQAASYQRCGPRRSVRSVVPVSWSGTCFSPFELDLS